MNPLIAMGFNSPDPVAAYAGGAVAKGRVDDIQNQNALRGFMRENGGAVMAGDQNALAQYAGFDPQGAMGIQQAQLGMEATRQGMAIDRERLGMARQQAAMQAAQYASQIGAQEAAQAAAELDKIGKAATVAYQQGPQAFQGFMAQYADQIPEEFQGVNYDNAPYAIAMVTGLTEGFQQAQAWRPATPDEAAVYGSQAGQFSPEGKFDPINPPSGMTIESDGAGGFKLAQGSGVTSGAKLTEGQGKDNMYSTMMRGSMADLDQYEASLTGLGDSALDLLPGNVGRFGQTEGYKIGENAAQEFTTAILRKQSGAAITPDEQRISSELYIPSPSDGPGVLARKKQARARALAAVESGMSPEQIIMQERAINSSGGDAATKADGSAPDWLLSDVTTWTPEQMEQAEEYWGLK